MARRTSLACMALYLAPVTLCAQTAPDLAKILERLDRLEAENRALSEQVRALQAQLGTPAPPPPTVQDRLDIQEQRVEEQAQTKVEASQKFPIRLTGMALFNAFANSKQSGGIDYPTIAAPTGAGHSGATVRQTVVGLDFGAPQAIWGGKVSGNIFMDFYTGGTLMEFHMRTASLEIAWKDRRVAAGLEKPIFNPRNPTSLAQVWVPPLTGAGNLWEWLPQVRFEQEIHLDASTGVLAQVGAVQTREIGPYTGTVTTEAARPISTTSWTTTGVWRSRQDFTPARRTRAASPSRPTYSPRIGSSIHGSPWSSAERSMSGKTWRTWAVGRSRASCSIRAMRKRWGAGADGDN